MKHAYKTQLLENLRAYYYGQNLVIRPIFDNGRDEILFVLPDADQINQIYKDLMNVLAVLPDINRPAERTVIGFCLATGEGYRSHLINPNTQDEINLALIGYRPERKIRPEELAQSEI